MISTCISLDESVINHSAVVDKDGDLVHVGDYLAYQSDGSNEVNHSKLLRYVSRLEA